MIRGSDGLDYEDLGARLLGELAKTRRNRVLAPDAPYSEELKADYRETYDHYEAAGYAPDVCHLSARAQADLLEGERFERRRKEFTRRIAGDFRAHADRALYDALRSGRITLYSGEPPSGSPGGAGGANPVQAALAALRATPEPPIRRGVGPQRHLPASGEVQRRRGEGSEPPADDPDAAAAREV